jgi:hypothetical protein
MSIKTYSFNDKTQLTNNFNVSEFKCKCGSSHSTKLSSELVEMLQKMTDLIKADYVLISSGYRCSTHDKNVGGTGTGPHTEGYAADCQFVKNGKPISTKLLSCVAQDLGFKGIANINNDYTYIHLDMKNRTYKGNEIINYNTVTSDFYKYYDIDKKDIIALEEGETSTSSTVNTVTTNSNSSTNSLKVIWSNKYDEEIKDLQKIFVEKGYTLTVDGYAGNNTYNVAKKFTVNKNDKGSLVKWVQTRLNNMGYSCGTADGICGNNTLNGIKAFQKANNLNEGYLGGTDWVYLLGGKIN